MCGHTIYACRMYIVQAVYRAYIYWARGWWLVAGGWWLVAADEDDIADGKNGDDDHDRRR